MRAVVYTRVSTAEQVENYSLAVQERSCIEFCEREGIVVDRVFREEGASAKNANRPVLQGALSYCVANYESIDYFVIYKFDRLARMVTDHFFIRSLLDSLDIEIRASQEPVDDTPIGHFLETLMAATAQLDNEQRADRTRAGMRAAAMSGRFLWRAPVGYLKSTTPGSPSLVPDPKTSPLVARAFELFATGMRSKRGIVTELTNLGLVRRGKPLTPQALGLILRNPVYLGRVVSPGLGVDAEGDFEPLVSAELFDRVQGTRNPWTKAEPNRRKNHPDFPLRRFIICETCRSPLTGSWSKGRSKKYAYYRCPRSGCLSVSVPKDTIEQEFVAVLESVGARRPVLLLLAEVVRDAWKEHSLADARLMRAADARLADLERRSSQLMESYVYDKAIDSQTYETERHRLEEGISEANAGKPSRRFTEREFEYALERAARILTDLPGYWNRLSLQDRPAFLTAVFPDGLVYGDEGFGTGESPCFFYEKGLPDNVEESLVEVRGFEPLAPTLRT